MEKITTKTGDKESLFVMHEHKQNPLSHGHTCSKKGNSMKVDSSIKPAYYLLGTLVAVMLSTGTFLVSSKVNADNDTVVDNVSIEVPVSCSMGGTGMNTHTATLPNGTYSGGITEYASGIGSTTLSVFCNDNNGFSVYAIGYTNNEEGNNTLKGANTNLTIPTGLYTSGTTTDSTWSMKIIKGTDSGDTQEHPLIIDNNFNNFHTVPGEQEGYTKIAHKTAATAVSGTPSGATLTTTYDAYISTTQAADTYTGQVKYVMVHPYDHAAPVIEIPGVYTLSRADSGESATQIGEPIPNDTATYNSPAEVMNAWEEVWGEEGIYPFYLKHTVVNDIITESYLGFTISPELAADSEGMISGDYALRGGVDESNSQDKPVFTANVNLLKRVYDYANHPERCEGDSDYFSCNVENSSHPDPGPSASSDGVVGSFKGMHCAIGGDGWSSCEWQ